MKIREQHTISKKMKQNYRDDSTVDYAWKTLKEEMDKYKKRNPLIDEINIHSDYKVTPEWPKRDTCLHTNCPDCKRTPNHVPMISCPCSNCSPIMFGDPALLYG